MLNLHSIKVLEPISKENTNSSFYLIFKKYNRFKFYNRKSIKEMNGNFIEIKIEVFQLLTGRDSYIYEKC